MLEQLRVIGGANDGGTALGKSHNLRAQIVNTLLCLGNSDGILPISGVSLAQLLQSKVALQGGRNHAFVVDQGKQLSLGVFQILAILLFLLLKKSKLARGPLRLNMFFAIGLGQRT